MLELSDNAVREIKELTETGGLRFVAREGEEGSYSFDPSLADEPAGRRRRRRARRRARSSSTRVAAEKLADVIARDRVARRPRPLRLRAARAPRTRTSGAEERATATAAAAA